MKRIFVAAAAIAIGTAAFIPAQAFAQVDLNIVIGNAPPPRDGDGVPNRYDHRPDNPYRY